MYRTTPTAVLFQEAGLPSGEVALENAKLRFAVHLQTVDCSHPLAHRMKIPTIQRGTGAERPQQPRTKVQRHGGLLDPVPRPLLVPPHYTPGCRVNPTEGLEKKAAAERFNLWWKNLSTQDVTILSDGSEQRLDSGRHVTYGYAIYQNQKLLKTGRGSLNSRSHIFDAEAAGAWQGLREALNDPTLRMRRLWMCIDSISVIWCLRGNASSSSQWAFLRCQEAMGIWDVCVRWSQGHMGIEGNEEADGLADLEAQDPHEPYHPAAETTVIGLRTDARKLYHSAKQSWWKDVKPKLSTWYRKWELPYNTTPPQELNLSRRVLTKFLATRTMHGDFAWYHRKYKHDDAELLCSYGKDKSPDHLIHCPRMRRWFLQWPARPAWPPSNTKEGKKYLQQLLSCPEDFADFIRLAKRT